MHVESGFLARKDGMINTGQSRVTKMYYFYAYKREIFRPKSDDLPSLSSSALTFVNGCKGGASVIGEGICGKIFANMLICIRKMAGAKRLELLTYGFGDRRSTN